MDYFAQTNFSGGIEVLIVQIQDHIRDEFGMGTAHGHHPDFFRVYTLYGLFILVFFEYFSFFCYYIMCLILVLTIVIY